MNQHAKIEELIAVRALGASESGDDAELQRLMASHGPDCAECRRLADESGEVAGRLAFAVGPEEIPSGMEDRVVALAVRPARRSGFGLKGFVAVAAAAVLVVVGGIGGYFLAPNGSGGTLDAEAARYLSRPNVHVASLEGSVPGTVTLAYQPGASVSYLIGSDLAPTSKGKVYELWFFHGSTPVPATTFQGGDVTLARIPADASRAQAAAITIERTPGVKKPTTKPIFTGAISA